MSSNLTLSAKFNELRRSLRPKIFVPAVYFYIGPILRRLRNVFPANVWAITCAILVFTANIANLLLAPQIIGWLRLVARSAPALSRCAGCCCYSRRPVSGRQWHLWARAATTGED